MHRAGPILLTPNERRVTEDRRECYWFCVVTDCDMIPRLQEPMRDRPGSVGTSLTKVGHYYLSVDAMMQPIRVREDTPPYGGHA